MNFTDFFNEYNGKSVEKEDASNLDQCFDLAFAWCDALQIPRDAIRHLNAFQIYTDATDITRQYFDLIENTPEAVPQVGDIVVFSTVVGPAGHVSIANGIGDTNSFQSFDQNWDTARDNHGTDPVTGLLIPYSHLVTHTYNGVLGWLRSKAPLPTPNDQIRIDRDRNWNLFISLTSYLGITVDGNNPTDGLNKAKEAIDSLTQKITDLTKEVGDLSSANTSLKTNISEVEKQNTALLGQLQTIHTSDSTAIDQGLLAEKALKEVATDMQTLATALNTTYPSINNLLKAIDSLYKAKPVPAKKTLATPGLRAWLRSFFT